MRSNRNLLARLGHLASKIDDFPVALAAWGRRQRVAYRERGWRGVFTPMRVVLLAATLLIGTFVTLAWITRPPPLPGYAAVVANWKPSEAWLSDRNGRSTTATAG
jgi:penicillin-binding protein 1C